MRQKIVSLTLLLVILLSACAPAATSAPLAGVSAPSSSSSSSHDGNSATTGIQSGILTAGDIDDNLNFAAFLHYLNSMRDSSEGQALPSVSLADRVTLRIVDAADRGVANARVSIFAGDSSTPLLSAYAGADGVFYFFPTYDGADGSIHLTFFPVHYAAGDATHFTARISLPDSDVIAGEVSFNLQDLNETRSVDVKLTGVESTPPNALDLMLVIDATGSMGDEINYLKVELRSIVDAIRSEFPDISMRFSLIVYRDHGDEYVVRSFDFTDSIETLQTKLAQQVANGGGDYPEAMDEALSAALGLQWRDGNTARVMFLIADAPPHDQNLSAAFSQVAAARQQGIKIYSLVASGVADTAEYMMRIMAATTHSRYLFLTDDSGVGNSHAEPKVPCYVVSRLDQLMIRVITSELSGQRVEATDEQVIRSVGQQTGGVCG